jgi:hypothetical protein
VAMLEELTEEELKMELGLSQAECQVFIRSMHKHSEDVCMVVDAQRGSNSPK